MQDEFAVAALRPKLAALKKWPLSFRRADPGPRRRSLTGRPAFAAQALRRRMADP